MVDSSHRTSPLPPSASGEQRPPRLRTSMDPIPTSGIEKAEKEQENVFEGGGGARGTRFLSTVSVDVCARVRVHAFGLRSARAKWAQADQIRTRPAWMPPRSRQHRQICKRRRRRRRRRQQQSNFQTASSRAYFSSRRRCRIPLLSPRKDVNSMLLSRNAHLRWDGCYQLQNVKFLIPEFRAGCCSEELPGSRGIQEKGNMQA